MLLVTFPGLSKPGNQSHLKQTGVISSSLISWTMPHSLLWCPFATIDLWGETWDWSHVWSLQTPNIFLLGNMVSTMLHPHSFTQPSRKLFKCHYPKSIVQRRKQVHPQNVCGWFLCWCLFLLGPNTKRSGFKIVRNVSGGHLVSVMNSILVPVNNANNFHCVALYVTTACSSRTHTSSSPVIFSISLIRCTGDHPTDK